MRFTSFIKSCYIELQEIETDYDVFQFLKRVCEEFDYGKFAVMFLPGKGETDLSAHFLVSNWPPELLKTYDELKLLTNSPIIAGIRETIEPLFWELEEINKKRGKQEYNKSVTLFREFDMLSGVYFPTYSASGKRGAVSFSGKRGPLDADELAVLHMVSLYVYNRVFEVTNTAVKDVPRITTREAECLLWASRGKTNAEIGTILSISENTVSGYITAISQKLNAVNKTHAVAKAMRNNLLT